MIAKIKTRFIFASNISWALTLCCLLCAAVPCLAEDNKDEATKNEAAKNEAAKVAAAENNSPTPTSDATESATTTKDPATPAPKPAAPIKLVVGPDTVNLNSVRDRQSLIAQLLYPSGITRDVTAQVQWQLADPSLVERQGNRLVPKKDGETILKLTAENLTVDVPVKVTQATADPPISFKNDVMPVFSKAGCNAGSCHGAARGKDGFRLSLYGFDPAGDYFRLTREMLGRRIDLAVPDDCLLMTKSTGKVAHTGGTLFKPDTEYYATLKRWLVSGAPNDPGAVPTVDRVELYPKNGLLDGEGESQQLSVRAFYSDGTDRDVTSLAYFSTNNDNSVAVDQLGKITAKNRGEAFIMARFDTHTVGSDFMVLPKNLEFQWKDIPENNYVDTLINNKLKKLRIQPSELCGDAEFARRVSLDICGVVPTTDELAAFIADPAADKRAKLVDSLLARKEFVDIWVMKWSELLQIRSTQQVSYKATLLYYNWLQSQIASNVPIDQMVQSLLGSEGGTFANAATNYYQNEQNTLKIAENVAQVFMGTRIQCAQCHNHPFDRWTMDDYYGFTAFFSQIGRKRAQDPREMIVYNRYSGETKHPVTQKVMAPKFLGGDSPETKGKDRRAVLAKWLTSTENPFFAKNLANIVWAHFFGKGIVQEVDDVRISNPPVNAELLYELGKKFTEYKYDFKKLVRDICTSRTYQLSTVANESNQSDSTNFSHASLRRIRSEIMLDVISQITETKNKFRGLPVGARAVQIADGNTSTYFLTTFGRAKRESVCSCEVKTDPNLGQALHMLNGDTVNNKVVQGGVIKRMLAEGKQPGEILDEIYVRCLSRKPLPAESEKLLAEVNNTENKQTALEDIFWAVLNSREFLFNH